MSVGPLCLFNLKVMTRNWKGVPKAALKPPLGGKRLVTVVNPKILLMLHHPTLIPAPVPDVIARPRKGNKRTSRPRVIESTHTNVQWQVHYY